MRRITFFLSVGCLVIGLIGISNAFLIDNGNGTITDTDRNLMWLQDAKYAFTSGYDADGLMSLNDAILWVDNLNFSGYGDWRLPTSLNSDGSGPCDGFNCVDSELGHLFYTELENTEWQGYAYQLGLTNETLNLGPFINLPLSHIWTSTTDGDRTLVFDFFGGQQTWHTNPEAGHWVMAVRDIAPIPEPTTMFLFGFGLLVLTGISRKKN